MKEVLGVLQLYLRQLVYVAQNLGISEAFAHLTDISMDLADLLSTLFGDVEEHICVQLLLQTSNLLDDVLSSLNVLSIDSADIHYLIEDILIDSCWLSIFCCCYFRIQVFVIVEKRVYNFVIEFLAVGLIMAKAGNP